MQDTLSFTFTDGYFDTGNYVEVPEGAFIYPSSNVVYDMYGRPVSFKGFGTASRIEQGGSRIFSLDRDYIGLFGGYNADEIGNMIQGVEKSLWFVGNESNNAVKVFNTALGEVVYTANLSSIPQVARWDYENSTWFDPVQVGLPDLGDADVPTLELTTAATRGEGFDGLVKGSRSVRVARKRFSTISIASPSSPVVTASENGDTLLVTIPVYAPDGSLEEHNSWILYFTYRGQGSTATHKQFPLEIPESLLTTGSDVGVVTEGNAKYRVLSQGDSQLERLVEVEFNDNELLPIEPNDDTFSLEACKFLAKLGNVMCGVGVGDDSTGFDVSYPNEYEAYPPDWRDWFSEVPVGIAPQEDMGFFWVTTANNTYIAKWTGVTEGAAPVVIEKVSNVFGSIGERAQVCVMGSLYFMSPGKIPVVISPDGQINATYGSKVLKAFESFDKDTQVSFDSYSNTVVFACGSKAIGYQLSTDKWTSPIDLGGNVLSMTSHFGSLWLTSFNYTVTENVVQATFSSQSAGPPPYTNFYSENHGLSSGTTVLLSNNNPEIPLPAPLVEDKIYLIENNDVDSLMIIDPNTNQYVDLGSDYDGTIDITVITTQYYTDLWNSGTVPPGGTWNITSAFQFGQFGRALKDITQVEAIVSTESGTGTLTFSAYKNFSVTTPIQLTTQAVTAGSLITVREYAESIDYDTIAAKISGTLGGQTIHSLTYQVDAHRIERLS